jgi:serine/threonine protein kinase
VRRFNHISRLGSGGMGDVYMVMDTTYDGPNKPIYALKIVDKEANVIGLIRESLDSMRKLGKICKSIADVKETYLFRTTATEHKLYVVII